MPDQTVPNQKKTGAMSHTPAQRVELSPAGIVEDKVFANELTELLNDALGCPALFDSQDDYSKTLRRKTVTLSRHAGKSVVRIAHGGHIFLEETGTEPLLKLIAKATKKYLG